MYWPAGSQHPGSICYILSAASQSVSQPSFPSNHLINHLAFPPIFWYFPDESVDPDSSCTITLYHTMQGRRKRASTREDMWCCRVRVGVEQSDIKLTEKGVSVLTL